jgi:phage regulator Rha-like protein
MSTEIVNSKEIQRRIYYIRNKIVMLDSDLAELYETETKRLNERVSRNIERFPADFMFQLTQSEYDSLRSQFATLKTARGRHRKYLPHAFTEQGIAMLSGVLTTSVAIQVNIQIMRSFIKMREMLTTQAAMMKKIQQNEQKLASHDANFKLVFDAIRQIQEREINKSQTLKKRRIGFGEN